MTLVAFCNEVHAEGETMRIRRGTNRVLGEHTGKGEDGAVGAAARQEVGHVAAAGVDKDGARVEVVGHLRGARTELLTHAPVQPVCQLRQHYLPMLLLPARLHAVV